VFYWGLHNFSSFRILIIIEIIMALIVVGVATGVTSAVFLRSDKPVELSFK
jgi:hypothetical protein